MLSGDSIIKLIGWGAAGWKFVSGQQYFQKQKEKHQAEIKSAQQQALFDVFRSVHLGFSHSARCLAMQMTQRWDKDHDVATRLAIDMCTSARDAMSQVVGTSPLSCCMKMMTPRDEVGQPVGTWARSTPLDGRQLTDNGGQVHYVHTNTVWSALVGVPDNATVWRPGITCFACNDLPAAQAKFKCDREDWSNYYQSTLVFPMRYAKRSDGSLYGRIGFLAFDAPTTDAFPGLPNIFDYTTKTAEYVKQLHASPAFHLGAIFADTIGTLLGAAYEAAKKRKGILDEKS